MIVMGLCVAENDSKDERSQRLRCRKPGQQGVYTSDESRIHQALGDSQAKPSQSMACTNSQPHLSVLHKFHPYIVDIR